MACPFSRRSDSLPRQGSIVENITWNIEDDLAEIPDDALALTHLQLAIQLLTAPSVSFIFYIWLSIFSVLSGFVFSILE